MTAMELVSGIERGKELFLGDLFHRPLGKLLGLAEKYERILEVRGCEVDCHAISLVKLSGPTPGARLGKRSGIESSKQNENQEGLCHNQSSSR
jgi:hypothetical protein